MPALIIFVNSIEQAKKIQDDICDVLDGIGFNTSTLSTEATKKELFSFRHKTIPCIHVWKFYGKRPCKRSHNGVRIDMKTGQECSENFYVCSACGEEDYGEPGGPAHAECEKCPFDWSDR